MDVAIVGGGFSGLMALEEIKKSGLNPTLFESKKTIGGLWRPEEGGVWNGLQMNFSRHTCKIPDFPWKEETQEFPNQTEVYQYQCDYVRHNDLEPYIHVNAKVINISKKEGKWKIEWLEDAVKHQREFEFVIIAAGIFSKGVIPPLSGLDSFKGQYLHSQNYKDPKNFAGKKVLVLGNSFSGNEIASEVSREASRVIHVFGKAIHIIPRYIPINDQMVPVDKVFYQRKNMGTLVSSELENQKKHQWLKSISNQKEIAEVLEVTNYKDPPYVSVSDTYLNQVEKKQIVLKKSKITNVFEKSIVFEDGSEEVDHIIFCTGYESDLSFLDKNVQSSISYEPRDKFKPLLLFKSTWTEDPSIGFIGLDRGPFLTIIKLQAKWIADVFSKKIPHPSLFRIKEGMQQAENIRHLEPKPQFPFKYIELAEDIAEEIGLKPDYEKMKVENPEQFKKLWDDFYDNSRFL